MQIGRVLIFGGSSGIGMAVARVVLQRDGEVVMVGRSRERLERAEGSLGEWAPRVTTAIADVAVEADVAARTSRVGAVDHIVCTAGGLPYSAPVSEFDLDAGLEFLRSRLLSAILIAKRARGCVREGGSITFTSGSVKERPLPGSSLTAATSAALSHLVRSLAMELAPMRINVVSPGLVDSPMWAALPAEEIPVVRELAERTLVGRFAEPEEIALAYLFLMESRFTTGSTVDIDGGFFALP